MLGISGSPFKVANTLQGIVQRWVTRLLSDRAYLLTSAIHGNIITRLYTKDKCFIKKYYRQNGQPYAQRELKTYILYIYISNYTLLTLSALRVGDWEGRERGGITSPL